MIDDSVEEVFLTRRQLQRDGALGSFVEENQPERAIDTLAALSASGRDMSQLIILLDINMPRLSGFEVLRQIRAREAYRMVPVIMLSASDDETDKSQAHSLGADGYIVKPLSLIALQMVLRSVRGDETS
jgi:DNA-binding response OmpR family regulator